MRILVLAGESADLGPRATLLGLCQVLRESVDALELMTTLPDETAPADATPLCPGDLRAVLAAAQHSRLVLLTRDALAGSPLRNAALMQMLALRRAHTIGIALAPVPPQRRLQRWLNVHALRQFSSVTAAEHAGASALEQDGVHVTRILPDPALLIPAAYKEGARAALTAAGAPDDGTALLGVVPRPIVLAGKDGAGGTERLVTLLARTVDAACERHRTFVVWLPARGADVALCEALDDAMSTTRSCIAPLLGPSLFKGVASELSLLLSSHRRAALLAAGVGRPTVGLGDPALLGSMALPGSDHGFLDGELFLRGALSAQLGELIDAAMERPRTSLVHFEELRAQVLDTLRELLTQASN
jgi:hypothetical protein